MVCALLALIAGACSGGAAAPPGPAVPGAAGDRIEVAAPDSAVRAYELTGQVTLRIGAAEGAQPRRFTVNGVLLSSRRAVLAFDGEAQPARLRVTDGAVLIHDPVRAAPGVTLHGLGGMVLLQPGQRLLLGPGGLSLEDDPPGEAVPNDTPSG